MLSSGMLPVPESARLQPASGRRTHRGIRSYHSDVPEWEQPTEGLIDWGPSVIDPNGNVFPAGTVYPMQTLAGFDAFIPRRGPNAYRMAPRGHVPGQRPLPVPQRQRPLRRKFFGRFRRPQSAPMMGFDGVRETLQGLPKFEMGVGAALGYLFVVQNRAFGFIAGAALGYFFGPATRKALAVGITAVQASQQVDKIVDAATAP